MAFWLVKSEPIKYSWTKFKKDKKTIWDGVRNYQARNNLRAMQNGDFVLFYHSNEGLEIVGIAIVIKEAYQDPTTDNINWVVVELAPHQTLKKSVSLTELKQDPLLKNMAFVKQGRLSVSPVTPQEFERILQLSGTNV